MEINLSLYKIFAVAANAGSFSKAAKELYISQPAVSQSMHQLEDSLSVKLFIRNQNGIHLTKEGKMLLDYVQSALTLIAEGENKIERVKDLTEGELRVGASDTVSKWFLLPCLEMFHRAHPDISITVTNRTSLETIELLKSGRIDMGFVNMPLDAKGVVFQKCMEVHDIFVAGEKYKKLRDKELKLIEIAQYPLIMLEQASNSRRWVDSHFMKNGIILEPQIEMGSHDLLADYAEIGLGIACVIEEFSQKAIKEHGIFKLKLKNPPPERSLGICYLKEIGLTTAAKKFLEMIEETRPCQ